MIELFLCGFGVGFFFGVTLIMLIHRRKYDENNKQTGSTRKDKECGVEP